MQTRAYQISDRPGATLCIGIPTGRTRPAMWLSTQQTGQPYHVILSQFHGEREAVAAANFLDTLIGQVQRVIDHLAEGDK